jgi:DNA gyrase/topoisomerase IV subunit B
MKFAREDIEVLNGIEAVRRRPAMYVGSLDDPTVPNHLLQEMLCVVIDDATVGLCQRLQVRIAYDGVADIADDGPGWPVEKDVTGKPQAESYMTTLLACRRAKANPSVGEGLCRAGLAVTNALSERCVLTTSRDGWEWRQEYRQGSAITDFPRTGPTQVSGTRLSFKLDASLLPKREFVTEQFVRWVEDNACVLSTEVIDQRTGARFLAPAR